MDRTRTPQIVLSSLRYRLTGQNSYFVYRVSVSVRQQFADTMAFARSCADGSSSIYAQPTCMDRIELQHSKERQAAGIAVAKKRGVYTGRQQGTTKAAPARARVLRKQGLTVLEIAQALGVKERTVYHYLSNG